MLNHYDTTEQDLDSYRDFLISQEKEQISNLREYHKERIPDRFFDLVVWDYEFPERRKEVVEVTISQMEIPFFQPLDIHF